MDAPTHPLPQANTTKRTHLTQQEKVAIVTLDHMSYKQAEVGLLLSCSTRTIQRILTNTRNSTTDHSLPGLLRSPYLRPDASAPHRKENRASKHRIPPGGVIATAIRHDALRKYRDVEPVDAANDTIDDLLRAGVVAVAELEVNERASHRRRRLAGEVEKDRGQLVRWLDH